MHEHDNNQRSHEQLETLVRQKEAAVQAKGRLIDNMAYQIRTLSNAVIGFSDLLMTEDLTDELMEYVDEINQAGNGLSALVNEVLDWARLESGRLHITKTECNLSKIVGRLGAIAASVAADKGLSYQIETDPALPVYIYSDEERLLKSLINLAANAFKYTPTGTVRICLRPEQRDGQDCVRIDIIDSGVGIAPDRLARLFEPTLDEQDAHDEVLTMLDMGFTVTAGLPLTKQLVEVLGGTLEVTSEPDVGSTFSVIVPTGLPEAPTAPLREVEAAPAASFEADDVPPVILLVEDQPSNRTVIRLMLEMLDVAVEVAEDGQEGFEMACQTAYDLILMDIKMPRLDGYEATRKIRQAQVASPIVALSAKVLDDAENRQIGKMFDAFLTKPVDSRKLSETVRRFIPSLRVESPKTAPAETEAVVTFQYGN